ncbi:MAG: 50S ribosomal protein L11 methyltransferase, partial [Archangium sp.]|nr:50S ribosomal protein L11 methyltransferase [Archangium sp.]
MDSHARREVIRTVTAPIEIEGCPGLRARVCPEPALVWEALETAEGTRLGPPFWAHAWPGGVALAQWVTLHPELVRGKRVLDFASGGGVSAIASIRAGALSVLATELDVWARAAILENAHLNGVEETLSVTGDDVTSRDD